MRHSTLQHHAAKAGKLFDQLAKGATIDLWGRTFQVTSSYLDNPTLGSAFSPDIVMAIDLADKDRRSVKITWELVYEALSRGKVVTVKPSEK